VIITWCRLYSRDEFTFFKDEDLISLEEDFDHSYQADAIGNSE